LTRANVVAHVTPERVAEVRAFSRFYTNLIGVLRESLLRTPYTLTQARVIYELGQQETCDLAFLRRSLDIDAGYLSRILARFEADGLLTRARSSTDGRRQVIGLTPSGVAAFHTLDSRSAEEIAALLSPLSEEEQGRLVAAMGTIRSLLGEDHASEPFVLRPPEPGDFGWVVHRHGVLYAEEYGWNETFESLVARIVADFIDHRDPKREAAWIAEVDGERVGCVFCVKKEETVAQLRILLVEPSARGMGIGSRLIEECLRFARRAGYDQIMLWTNDVLVDARRLYERAGFELVEEEAHHSFGHDLIGQNWRRNL
jgi:DNA-binding MarR family transcriptional regulator/GNAT superfamily N-acetyltransferase